MLAAQRQQLILGRISQTRFLSARDLAAEFGISYSTIARDLDRLAARGLIERINGGAAALPDGVDPGLSWAG